MTEYGQLVTTLLILKHRNICYAKKIWQCNVYQCCNFCYFEK